MDRDLADWDVVENDQLDDQLLAGAARVIQAWFPHTPGEVVPASALRWKLGAGNPAGPGFMTVAVAEGEVVGAMTVVRKRWVLHGAEVSVAEVGDVFTDRRYLKGGRAKVPWTGEGDARYLDRSVFGRLSTETMHRADRAGVSLYFGIANEAAMPGWIKRLGFRRWEGEPLTTWTRPGGRLLAERTRLPHPVAVAVERAHATASAAVLARSRGYRWSELRAGGDLGPIDELWERSRGQWPFQPVRDASWFRFRFLEQPTATYRLWLIHRRGRLVGVTATRAFRDGRGNDVVDLADRLFDRTAPDLLPAAVALMAKAQGRPGTHSYGTWSQEAWPRRAQRVGGVLDTYRPGLILRDNPAARLAIDGVQSVPWAIAASDNI